MVLLFPKMLHTPEKNFFQNSDVTFPVFAYLLVKQIKTQLHGTANKHSPANRRAQRCTLKPRLPPPLGLYKYMPMAFLHLLSSQYFRRSTMDIFEFFTSVLKLDGIIDIEKEWGCYDFSKLVDCQSALEHCDNNNGAMVVIIKEEERKIVFPSYKLGFLLGPEDAEGEKPFARWVKLQEFLRHQCRYDEQRDDIFAHAFDALTAFSGTQYLSEPLH